MLDRLERALEEQNVPGEYSLTIQKWGPRPAYGKTDWNYEVRLNGYLLGEGPTVGAAIDDLVKLLPDEAVTPKI